MQSYAKGHGNSSALCSTGTTDLQDGVALSQNTSLNLSINRLQVFRSLYFIDQWREKLTIAQCTVHKSGKKSLLREVLSVSALSIHY